MEFETLIGNETIKEQLEKAVVSRHILHSYLFTGIEGIGKSLFAQAFAKKILCLGGEKENKMCDSCIKWQSKNHPDFYFLEPENGSIKIEQIRYLQEKIEEMPILSNRKVYLIKEVDLMTREAQNCLLKTLEEPPKYAIIILTTSNESKVLNTIKSRCMKVVFSPLADCLLEEYSKKNFAEPLSQETIQMCRGSIGSLVNLQEKKEQYAELEKWLQKIEQKDRIELLQYREFFVKNKEMIQELLDYMIVFFHYTKEIRKWNCIPYIEETKKRLLANSNYDMCMDYLLMKIGEEVSEKYCRNSI